MATRCLSGTQRARPQCPPACRSVTGRARYAVILEYLQLEVTLRENAVNSVDDIHHVFLIYQVEIRVSGSEGERALPSGVYLLREFVKSLRTLEIDWIRF